MLQIKEMLSLDSYRILEDLKSGKLTERSFHSKRWYARKNKNIKILFDLACAWEAFKIGDACE